MMMAEMKPHKNYTVTSVVRKDVNSREIAFPGLEAQIPGLVGVSNWLTATHCGPATRG